MKRTMQILAAALLAATGSIALAALPPPSPAQAQAAAAKKAAADAQAQKDKEALLAAMDRVAVRYRAYAMAQGRKTNPPVAVAAAPAALAAPAAAAGPTAQPGGRLGPSAQVPARTEKAGTAAPSADVKKAPSRPMPRQERR